MGILNDIIGMYKASDEKKKRDIIGKIIKHIWNSKCDYIKITKKIEFEIDDRIIDEELFDILCRYNDFKYKKMKSKYDSSSMTSFDYVKVHINNLYAYLFDSEVYNDKRYIYNLMRPRNIYFEYIKGMITKEQVIEKLKEFDKKNINNTKKYEMSFENYKKLINYYIPIIINNLETYDEYLEKNEWENRITKEDFNYDNLLITYINKSLTGYLRNYIRENYKQCEICGMPIIITSNNRKYCPKCWKEYRRNYKTEKQREYRKN